MCLPTNTELTLMHRELSSPYYWVYRWLIPGMLTLAAVAVLWWYALADSGPRAVLPATLVCALLMIIARLYDRAKRVWLEDEHLIVGWYGKTARLPLQNIRQVSSTPGLWPPRICIQLSKPAPFGDRICFFPPVRTGLATRLINELTGLAENQPKPGVETDGI